MWQRFREIPEWIKSQSRKRSVPIQTIVDELEELRKVNKCGLNRLVQLVKVKREDEFEAEARAQRSQAVDDPEGSSPIEVGATPGSAPSKKRRAPPRAPRKRAKTGA